MLVELCPSSHLTMSAITAAVLLSASSAMAGAHGARRGKKSQPIGYFRRFETAAGVLILS